MVYLGLPINSMLIFHGYVSHNQMVSHNSQSVLVFYPPYSDTQKTLSDRSLGTFHCPFVYPQYGWFISAQIQVHLSSAQKPLSFHHTDWLI